MGFGTSYSLVHVDCLDWVHTHLFARILRGLLGCGIALGVYECFQLIPCNDNPTKFFFLFALPSMVLSFFIYGVFPIICAKIKLVKDQSSSLNYKDKRLGSEGNEDEDEIIEDKRGA